MKDLKPGTLFLSVGKTNCLTTDPWGMTHRTITYADHMCLDENEIVMLIEAHDMEGSGIYVWLRGPRVVWQILTDEAFEKSWEAIELHLDKFTNRQQ